MVQLRFPPPPPRTRHTPLSAKIQSTATAFFCTSSDGDPSSVISGPMPPAAAHGACCRLRGVLCALSADPLCDSRFECVCKLACLLFAC